MSLDRGLEGATVRRPAVLTHGPLTRRGAERLAQRPIGEVLDRGGQRAGGRRVVQPPFAAVFHERRDPIDGRRDECALPPPTLGEHTDAVLAELGYDADAIAELRAVSVI